MDCWIGVVREVDRRVVRLAGRLTAVQLPELLETCVGAGPPTIDLAELVSADPAGIEALQRLRSKGATLAGAPGYIQLKLDLPTNGPTLVPPPARRRP